MGIQHIELKLKVISCYAENRFRALIFNDHELTNQSLVQIPDLKFIGFFE